MTVNPPPVRCEGCGRTVPARDRHLPAPGDPAAWHRADGTDRPLVLEDGRSVVRPVQGWVCPRCGHTVHLSRELADTGRG